MGNNFVQEWAIMAGSVCYRRFVKVHRFSPNHLPVI